MKNFTAKVDQYFLSQQSPFSSKKTLRTKPLKVLGAIGLVATIMVLLFTEPGSPDGGEATETKVQRQHEASTMGQVSSIRVAPMTEPYLPSGYYEGSRPTHTGSPKAERQYTASQFVAPLSQNLMNNGSLPLASTIAAKLTNSVISTDSMSPVIAETTSDAFDPDSTTVIPAGTQIIGQASFDDQTRRLQIRFNAVVFEDGTQRQLSGIALLADGSAGLTGEYHSSSLARQAGRFLSTFVGGLADGMKDKEVTPTGQAFERGTVKNGVLNGIANAATDQAQVNSQEMERVRPFLEVAKDTAFLIYLDKEFVP